MRASCPCAARLDPVVRGSEPLRRTLGAPRSFPASLPFQASISNRIAVLCPRTVSKPIVQDFCRSLLFVSDTGAVVTDSERGAPTDVHPDVQSINVHQDESVPQTCDRVPCAQSPSPPADTSLQEPS